MTDWRLEGLIICNCLYLSHAFANQTFNYRFSIPPGIHALDLLYTFYPTTVTVRGEQLSLPVPLLHAQGLQSYFTSFVKHGDPNIERRPVTVEWPLFGDTNMIVDVGPSGFSVVGDREISVERCKFWQSAPYIGRGRPIDKFQAHMEGDSLVKFNRDEL